MKKNNWESDGVNAAHSAKRDWLFDVSAKFVRNRELSVGARFLFLLIKSYQGADGTLPFPSLQLLSDLTGRERHTVQRYILELATAGYLIKKQPRGSNGTFGSVHYALSWQPKAEKLPAVQPQAGNVPTIISHLQHLPPSTSPTMQTRQSVNWRKCFRKEKLEVIDVFNQTCVPRGWLEVNKFTKDLDQALGYFVDSFLPGLPTEKDLLKTFREAATLRDAGDPAYTAAKGNKLIRILYRD